MNENDIKNLIERRKPHNYPYVDTIQVGSQTFEGKLLSLIPKRDRPMGHFIEFEVSKAEGKELDEITIARFNDVMTISVNGENFNHVPQ